MKPCDCKEGECTACNLACRQIISGVRPYPPGEYPPEAVGYEISLELCRRMFARNMPILNEIDRAWLTAQISAVVSTGKAKP